MSYLDGAPLADDRAQAEHRVLDLALLHVAAVADDRLRHLALLDGRRREHARGGVDGAVGVVELELGRLQGKDRP